MAEQAARPALRGAQRRVLITGGVSGLGRALVDEYLQLDETLAIHVWDIDEAAGQALQESQAAIHFQRVDLGDEQEVCAAVADLLDTTGEEKIDTVICNAGISSCGGFPYTDWDAEMRVMRINLHGHLRLLRELLAQRRVSDGGRVAFVISASVVLPFPLAVVYAASKAGLNGFADSLEPWLRHYGISVTRIYPGPMRTPHQEKYYADLKPHSGVTPEKVARISARAIRRRKRRVWPDGPAKFFRLLSAVANWSMPRLMHRYSMKFSDMLYPPESETPTPKAAPVNVVTGVTSGLGRALLSQLAATGEPVIAVARPGAKAREVIEEVCSATGNSTLTLVEADLSSLAQIQGAAVEIKRQCGSAGIRRLVLNAATLTAQPQWTDEGFEEMLAVNHLGAASLALALETSLKRCEESQICVVSSAAHRWVEELSIEALLERDASKRLPALKTYGATKLTGLVFFNELAKRWPEVRITAHHPGFVSTNLGMHGSWPLRWWWRLSRWRMRDADEAAVELLKTAAVDDAVPAADGVLRYWEKAQAQQLPASCADRDLAARVWELSSAQAPPLPNSQSPFSDAPSSN